MKKVLIAVFLTVILSLSVFADDDGHLPTGNKNCSGACFTATNEQEVKYIENDNNSFVLLISWLEKCFTTVLE